MFEVTIAIISLYCLFTIIGLAPCAFIFKQSKLNAIAAAPSMGIVLTTLAGTYLTLFNYSVMEWAESWLILSSTTSLLLTFLFWKKSSLNFHAKYFYFFAGLMITIILLLSPMLIGDLRFTLFRGNGTDTFNYMTMAGYLQHEPYAWLKVATPQLLLEKHPTYVLAQEILKTRWSTPMLLAWCAQISHLPLYRIEYGFTTLFFIMLYSGIYHLNLKLSFQLFSATLIALSIAIGFWAQLILDMRAMSQISILPVLILFLIFFIEVEMRSNLFIQIFLSFTTATLILLYIEMLPFILVSIGILFILNRFTIRKYFFPAILTSLIILPIIQDYLFAFFTYQIHVALYEKNTWHLAYFHWLYFRPLLNFWGNALLLHTLPMTAWYYAPAKLILSFLGVLLSALFLMSVVYCIGRKKLNFEINLIFSFLLASLIGFLFLYFRHQLWAAGKFLSYGYPFIILIMAIMALIILPHIQIPEWFKKLSKYSVMIWLVIQCSLGGYRISYSYLEKIYPHNIVHHYEYLRHNWQIDQFTAVLKKYNAKSIGIMVPNCFLAEYLDFVWGWDIKVTNLLTNPSCLRTEKITPTLENPPEYLILSTQYRPRTTPLAKNKDFILLKYSKTLAESYLNR